MWKGQRVFKISHSSGKCDAKVNILPFTWQVSDNKYAYQTCKIAVNIKVYRGFNCRTAVTQFLTSQLSLFILLDNTYKYVKSEDENFPVEQTGILKVKVGGFTHT